MKLKEIEDAYKLRISNNTENIIETNKKIINLLDNMEKKIDNITIIYKEEKSKDKKICTTSTTTNKINEIICNKKIWDRQDLDEKAFTVIHEFSHMWIGSDDNCYFNSKEKEEKDCAKNENKTNTASAIEYYIKDIYAIKPGYDVKMSEKKEATPNVE